MSATWGQIREWSPETLDEAFAGVRKRCEDLDRHADDLRAVKTEHWLGEAAEAAVAQRTRIRGEFEETTEDAAPVRRGLSQAADEIVVLQRRQEELLEIARVHHFQISEDGAVSDLGLPPGTPEDQAAAVQDERRLVRAELVDGVARVLAGAEGVDADLTKVFTRAAALARDIAERGISASTALAGRSGALDRFEPPKGADPDEVHEWWAALSADEQARMISENPAWVGSTDGIPAEDRHTANSTVMGQQQQELVDRRAELESKLSEPSVIANRVEQEQVLSEIDEINGKLGGIDDIENRLASTAEAPEDRRHYLLDIDTDNAGQAIIATGNPDTADNVATYVPGMGSNLSNIDERMNRSDLMHREADFAGSGSTSMITWQGYDTPPNFAAASRESYAEKATEDLAGFQDGLAATYEGPGDQNTTLFGHSYGSTTIGHTDQAEDLDVDQMVFAGSPGSGVENGGELSMNPEDVYATTAERDIIRKTPPSIHGPQPVGDDFGAQVFKSDSGSRGRFGWPYSLDAHSEYWEPSNRSLDNFGHIIAGEPLPPGEMVEPE